MYKKYFQISPILLFAFTLISCSVSKTVIPPTYDLIKFDSKNYSPTNPAEIIKYSARIDIPEKYVEIGTIKFKGEVDMNKIKELAAQNGANALLKEGNNYILLFFSEKKEGQKDAKTI
jgi:hypothetical protein